jgi:hypothetical protein
MTFKRGPQLTGKQRKTLAELSHYGISMKLRSEDGKTLSLGDLTISKDGQVLLPDGRRLVVKKASDARVILVDGPPQRFSRMRSAHVLVETAVRLLPSSERDRYLEEFRAELLDVPGETRLRHALSLLRGVFVLRLRRGPKNEAADAAARRAKG